MPHKIKKILAIFLCLCFLLNQTGFAQTLGSELNLSGFFQGLSQKASQDKFRPLHLRYLSYDKLENSFGLLVDKGDFAKDQDLQAETKKLMDYFFVGLALPNDAFWVNLRPDSSQGIIDKDLEQTDIGKVLLEADVQLKKDTAGFTSPATSEGRIYWDALYKKAEELFGYDSITIPTITRPWIVPGEIIIGEAEDSSYIYKATLKVCLEQDYLKNSSIYSFSDPRLKELNEYSSQLIRELIIPKLTKEVNTAKRYAPLRQVYYSLILSQWFKTSFQGLSSQGAASYRVDSRNLAGLTSKVPWSKDTYFQAYQASFKQGEYNLKEPHQTPFGQTIRSYMSGGIGFGSNGMARVIETGRIKMQNFRQPPVPKSAITASYKDGAVLLTGAEGTVSSPVGVKIKNSDVEVGANLILGRHIAEVKEVINDKKFLVVAKDEKGNDLFLRFVPSNSAKYLEVMQSLKKLKLANVEQVVFGQPGSYQGENGWIMATKLVKGDSLRAYIKLRLEGKPLEQYLPQYLQQIIQTGQSLIKIHEQLKVPHDDLGSENIIINEQTGIFTIVDFEYSAEAALRKNSDVNGLVSLLAMGLIQRDVPNFKKGGPAVWVDGTKLVPLREFFRTDTRGVDGALINVIQKALAGRLDLKQLVKELDDYLKKISPGISSVSSPVVNRPGDAAYPWQKLYSLKELETILSNPAAAANKYRLAASIAAVPYEKRGALSSYPSYKNVDLFSGELMLHSPEYSSGTTFSRLPNSSYMPWMELDDFITEHGEYESTDYGPKLDNVIRTSGDRFIVHGVALNKGGIKGLLSIMLEGRVRKDSSDGKSYFDRLDSLSMFGPYYVVVDKNALAKDGRLASEISSSGDLEARYHSFYLVPKDRDREILNAGIEEARKTNLISQATAAQIKSKIKTYDEIESVAGGINNSASSQVVNSLNQLANIKQLPYASMQFNGRTIATVVSNMQYSEGVYTYLSKLAGMLASRNKNFQQVIFFMDQSGGQRPQQISIGNSNIVFVPYKDGEDLIRLLQAEKPDLIITHVPFHGSAIQASSFAAQHSIPFIAYVHFSDVFSKKIAWDGAEEVLREALTQQEKTKVLAVSQIAKREIATVVPGVATEVVGPMVATDIFDPALVEVGKDKQLRKEYNISENDVVLLFPNTFVQHKNPRDLIVAVRDLIKGSVFKKGINNIKVVFMGGVPDVEYLDSLREYIRRENIDQHFIFLPSQPQSELRNWYSASDIVVLPSISESVGLVLIEAGLMEKPVIAANISGISETVKHGETGLLFDLAKNNAKRAKSLSDAILTLYNNPALRASMGKTGREFALKRFNPDDLILRHEAAYLAALPASSPVLPYKKDKGGIDFRVLPITTQQVNPRLVVGNPQPADLNMNLDTELLQIQGMVSSNIIPSNERIKDYARACLVQKGSDEDIANVLSCIAGILRLEEERVEVTDPQLRALIVLLESAEAS